MTDVFHEFSLKVGHRGEDPAGNDIAFDFGKPEFDLIEPGRVSGSEVQMHARVPFQELLDALGLVGREVVGDDVDLFAARLIDDDVSQEGDELSRRMSACSLAQHFAGFGIEGGVEGQCAVPVVLEAMPFGSPWGQRQHRIFAIECLNSGLFIDAEDSGVLRRMQIQTDDVCRFGLEVRIVGGHVALDPMGLQSMFAPDSRDHHVRDVQRLGKLARAPLGGPVCGFTLHGPLQDPRLQRGGQGGCGLTGVTTEQTREALSDKALTPPIDERIIAGELVADLGLREAGLEQKNESRTARLIGSTRLTGCSLIEFRLFHCRQNNRATREHDYTPFSVVTVH
jgi:hypothetical protein